ncbi:MAG: MBL fold metallo-hydrolase [Candidatus Hydrothermarchaeales archaeon]
MEIVFLGTGGGRWMTITQRLYTGGFRLHDEVNIHVDPGAGALVRTCERRINPSKTNAVMVSHCHPDHYTDAEVFIEAMTRGMTKRAGVFGGSRSVLLGNEKLGPAVSRYHKSMIEKEYTLDAGVTLKIGDIGMEALPTQHSDPEGVGMKFFTNHGIITYTGDTEYFEGMPRAYKGSSLMIINVIRPKVDMLKWHLCSEDVIRILNEVVPETAIITHFGMKMLPVARKEAVNIEAKTGVRTIAARDGMRFTLK